ncbi:hypothetical protein BKH42_05255 [Helicobacter sp. 13S00482-2]|uniref:hypothetical protein n=1 Tax=Helicobacter sp. 13S00482-2 TaxID=1476200 RepID=UPI000BA68EBB|nr:hypothetical protein [Helicobacter sp. 13S00482-2]PAF53589.1 hypothetical protein BKH42_05255 [Helicobacter sp. 13S00482-2]
MYSKNHSIYFVALNIFFLYLFLSIRLYAKDIPALDVDANKDGWNLELKKISLNFTSASLKNQTIYKDFSNNRIKGDSQIVGQAFGNFEANYYAKNFVIFNSLIAEYGRNIIYPQNSEKIDNKTLDRILIGTDYTQRIWKIEKILGGFEIGPYVQLGYQTEFTPQAGLDRRKILRFNTGFKIFDGQYIKNLHLNIFGEEDFTYKAPIESFGIETGLNVEHKIEDNITFEYQFNFRSYLLNNYPASHNPEYELELNAKLDTKVYKNFSVAPFISFYMLKGRYFKEVGTNVFIGVSISYSQIFIDAKQK